ncbi:MAG: DUF4275 family protein [Clostridia bacterium]|nr:DUF4275 family protein [Clostridia bacterium]
MMKDSLVNADVLLTEIRLAENLPNKREAQYRLNRLNRIAELVGEYQRHIYEYDAQREYQRKCKEICKRGLRFSKADKAEVASKWDRYFTSHLSEKQREQVFYDQFKWHIFSYDEVPHKSGKRAKAAFNRTKKQDAYIFIQRTDEAWYIENADLLKVADLSLDSGSFERKDVYIFDAQGKWTYVRTHEDRLCGPYFARREYLKKENRQQR